MAEIIIHPEKISDFAAARAICPFGAIEEKDGKLAITAACRGCRLCVKKGPAGAFEFVENTPRPTVDKSQWRGIAVVAEAFGGKLHPVTLELLGKARELAAEIRQRVTAVVIGYRMEEAAETLAGYGADRVVVYDDPALEFFRIEPYTAMLEDFIRREQPAAVLVGGTPAGRSLAPRCAARFRTGLTADCTVLGIQPNTDLDQIRPAYGGNIMAHINTPRHRPQFATVRYKIFPIPPRERKAGVEIVRPPIPAAGLASKVEVLKVVDKPPVAMLEDAEVIVAAGRGVQKKEDLAMLRELADLLGGKLAGSRPLAEAGWVPQTHQIGLSGRTVKPRLIITCGISGAIQFVAGMKNSDYVVAINRDADAPIFKVAHLALVGDLYAIVPRLLERIREVKP